MKRIKNKFFACLLFFNTKAVLIEYAVNVDINFTATIEGDFTVTINVNDKESDKAKTNIDQILNTIESIRSKYSHIQRIGASQEALDSENAYNYGFALTIRFKSTNLHALSNFYNEIVAFDKQLEQNYRNNERQTDLYITILKWGIKSDELNNIQNTLFETIKTRYNPQKIIMHAFETGPISGLYENEMCVATMNATVISEFTGTNKEINAHNNTNPSTLNTTLPINPYTLPPQQSDPISSQIIGASQVSYPLQQQTQQMHTPSLSPSAHAATQGYAAPLSPSAHAATQGYTSSLSPSAHAATQGPSAHTYNGISTAFPQPLAQQVVNFKKT